jgi:DNA-binding beta-propeller fold protein YncE
LALSALARIFRVAILHTSDFDNILMKPLLSILAFPLLALSAAAADGVKHLLYVATPGIRNDLAWGGHGVLVFDMDAGHKFVKRIPFGGLDEKGVPRNVKGVCASAATKRLYVSTTHTLSCIDLTTEKVLWEKPYNGGCDRMSMTPDGKTMYLPALEKDFWNVVNPATGDVLKRIDTPNTGSHNTVVDASGAHAYLAGLRSPLLRVVDLEKREITKEVGPFSSAIRPYTVNGKGTLCYVCVNGLLGFEIGDLTTGKQLQRVEVQGYQMGLPKRHGCPSHGVGLTPDEREVWVCDAANQRMHYFDAAVMPPKQLGSIECRDDPGWITFSIDGRYAYPSSGEVVDVATHQVIANLEDEEGRHVGSEKLLEIDFEGGTPVRNGDQFGLGRNH